MAQAKKATAAAAVDETQTEPDAPAAAEEGAGGEPGAGTVGDDPAAVGDQGGEPGEGDQVEGVTLADVAALAGVDPAQTETTAAAPRPYVNEGMRTEIEQHGHTFDPTTGRKVTAADLEGLVRGY